jgi:hypothetical protein
MTKIARSPERGSFNLQGYQETLKLNPDNENALEMIEYYTNFQKQQELKEQDPEWQRDNLEYDLRTNEDLCLKVKHNDFFAQNLYAALCNNEFIKNQPWNILQEKTWSCSWRYAGGIIAHMQEKGDYIDWYCSGIHNDWDDEDFRNATKEEQERYLLIKNNHVGEGHITDEVKDELFKLGWVVKENKDYPLD